MSDPHQGDRSSSLANRQSMLYAKDLARLYQLEKERAEDLFAGARIQERFLTPIASAEALLVEAGYEAAIVNTSPASISGDFFFPRPLGDGQVAFLLADACGHGLPAALLSMRIASFIQGAAGQAASPKAFLRRVDMDIKTLNLQGVFVAGLHAVFSDSGCCLANAGQPYPLLFSKGKIMELELPGPPLGLAAETVFSQQTYPLAEGDRLVLFTDGIVEATRPSDGECFGRERLAKVLISHSRATLKAAAEAVLLAVNDFQQGAFQEDDYTLVLIQKCDKAGCVGRRFSWTGETYIGALPEERQAVFNKFAADVEKLGGFSATEGDLLLLAMVEALNNAVEHGNRLLHEKRARVRYLIAPRFCLAIVNDQGAGFAPSFESLRESTGSRGRGLGIIKENTDLVFFNASGNTIVMFKGVRKMDVETRNATANINVVADGNVLVTDLSFGAQKVTIANGLSEIFEALGEEKEIAVYIDFKRVRLLSSMGWGILFGYAEKEYVRRIVLFNVSEVLLRNAEQMGLPRQSGPYAKINVLEGCELAMDILARGLSEALCDEEEK